MTAASVPPTKCLPLFATESVEEFGFSRVSKAVRQSGGISLRALGLAKLSRIWIAPPIIRSACLFSMGAAAPRPFCYHAAMGEPVCPGCQAFQRRVAELEAHLERLTRLLEQRKRPLALSITHSFVSSRA